MNIVSRRHRASVPAGQPNQRRSPHATASRTSVIIPIKRRRKRKNSAVSSAAGGIRGATVDPPHTFAAKGEKRPAKITTPQSARPLRPATAGRTVRT